MPLNPAIIVATANSLQCFYLPVVINQGHDFFEFSLNNVWIECLSLKLRSKGSRRSRTDQLDKTGREGRMD